MQKILSYPQVFRNWILGEDNRSFVDVQDTNKTRPILFFISCIALYCIYLMLMHGAWFLSDNMWVEAGTNYFPNSRAPSLITKLFALDFGYLPLPQRIIAAISTLFNFPASSIPYFYKWSATLLTAAVVGTFCLKPFRALVQNDLLRLLTSIVVLMIAPFEVRLFISFTYFSAFFIAIITALALVEKSKNVPRWSWFIPVLMVSKPAVLSMLPAMICVALVSKTRFKFITLISGFFCLAQFIRLAFSHATGVGSVSMNKFNLIEKLYATAAYFLHLLGAFFAKNFSDRYPHQIIWVGLGLLIICYLIVINKRCQSNALILVGLSLLFFNVLLNAFVLSDEWNINILRHLTYVPIGRHIICGYFGTILIIVGLIAACTNRRVNQERSWFHYVGPMIFLSWFVLSGWFTTSRLINREAFEKNESMMHAGLWTSMADAIDSQDAVGVPVAPVGWAFQRNCTQLDPDVHSSNSYTFKSTPMEDDTSVIFLEPLRTTYKNLISLSLLVRPKGVQSILVSSKTIVRMKDNTIRYLVGSRQLPASGGLLMLTSKEPIPINGIQSITIKFNMPIEMGFISEKSKEKPVILWMGN